MAKVEKIMKKALTSRHELSESKNPTKSKANIIEEKESQFRMPEAHALKVLRTIENIPKNKTETTAGGLRFSPTIGSEKPYMSRSKTT